MLAELGSLCTQSFFSGCFFCTVGDGAAAAQFFLLEHRRCKCMHEIERFDRNKHDTRRKNRIQMYSVAATAPAVGCPPCGKSRPADGRPVVKPRPSDARPVVEPSRRTPPLE
jgi:hypothetical protein